VLIKITYLLTYIRSMAHLRRGAGVGVELGWFQWFAGGPL